MGYFSKKNKKHQGSYKVGPTGILEIKIVCGGGYGKPHGKFIKLKFKKKDIKKSQDIKRAINPIFLKGGGYN